MAFAVWYNAQKEPSDQSRACTGLRMGEVEDNAVTHKNLLSAHSNLFRRVMKKPMLLNWQRVEQAKLIKAKISIYS